MSLDRGDGLYATERAQLALAAGTNAVASLQAGNPFSLLLAEDERQRATELESLLDAIADAKTRFVRATNPLRARLTLERLLIQVIGPDAAHADPATIVRRIAEQRGDETRVILIIESAETLHPEVLQFFGKAAPLFPDATPGLQLLFVGRPEFRRMMDDPGAGLDEQTALLEAYRPRGPEPSFVQAPAYAMEALPQRPPTFEDTSLRAQFTSMWQRGAAVRAGIVGGTLVGLGAIAFALTLVLTGADAPIQTDNGSALLEAPEPAENDPDPPALQAGPPSSPEVAQLRREFDAYLTASGQDTSRMTAGQRRSTFQEFMVWRARTQPARPTQ